MQKQNITSFFFIAAGTLVLSGAVMSLLALKFAPFVFSGGVAGLIIIQAKIAYDKRNEQIRNKRLSRISLFNSLLLILGAYSMFTGTNSWVVLVLIYALSSFFLTFRGDN
jgi:hypothetical protein